MIDAGILGRSLRGLRAAPRSGRRPAAIGRPRRRAPRLLGALAALVLVLGGGYLWLRSSSLVGVQRVTVSGVSGPDAPQIRSSLLSAARSMTTLDVRMGTLRAAVGPYPVVKGLRVDTHFPHAMTIHVVEQVPVAAITLDGRSIPVAADGTLLHDSAAAQTLPALTLRFVPGGERIQDPAALGQLAVLAAAPYAVLERVAGVSSGYWHGVVVQLRKGPSIMFGTPSRLEAKWQAALAVLGTPQTAGAAYVDVSDPERPAAG